VINGIRNTSWSVFPARINEIYSTFEQRPSDFSGSKTLPKPCSYRSIPMPNSSLINSANYRTTRRWFTDCEKSSGNSNAIPSVCSPTFFEPWLATTSRSSIPATPSSSTRHVTTNNLDSAPTYRASPNSTLSLFNPWSQTRPPTDDDDKQPGLRPRSKQVTAFQHWTITPVEYKRGKPKTNDCDRVQLCAQAMCLEEMLPTNIPRGDLFYGKQQRRTEVLFDEGLRATTRHTTDRLHVLIRSQQTPAAIREKMRYLLAAVGVHAADSETEISDRLPETHDSSLNRLTRSRRPGRPS